MMKSVHAPFKTAAVPDNASRGALLILVVAMLFNAVLAAVNAHGVHLGSGHVMLCEAAIMFAACIHCAKNSVRVSDNWPSLFFIYVILVLFFWSVLLNQNIYVKSVRDMLLMPIFIALGGLANERGLIKTMRYLTAVLIVFMVIEGWATELYVSLFQPAS